MGRGRAKAKQAKVARQLKYNSPDLDSLQRELSGKSDRGSSYPEDDQYAEWADWSPEDEDNSESKWR